ncbi:hypothetical protein Pyn_28143 [Prunus yedoensis var. nudiflora]|uniref:Uncharacterized protein n=1 Tax=Prunus yedoensis var. nudiflora TaxID=2094558 RepID=A0A314ZDJ2_PRUYE|nr:hypothetical protein Pyn_28143 [Prunus yedoensis var. nudiflora]
MKLNYDNSNIIFTASRQSQLRQQRRRILRRRARAAQPLRKLPLRLRIQAPPHHLAHALIRYDIPKSVARDHQKIAALRPLADRHLRLRYDERLQVGSPIDRDVARTPRTRQPLQLITLLPAASTRSRSSGRSGLWSRDRGVATPSRQRTAREFPELATTTSFFPTMTTTALDPTVFTQFVSVSSSAGSHRIRSRPPRPFW